MIKCECCKKEITKKNFWSHQHDDYVMNNIDMVVSLEPFILTAIIGVLILSFIMAYHLSQYERWDFEVRK